MEDTLGAITQLDQAVGDLHATGGLDAGVQLGEALLATAPIATGGVVHVPELQLAPFERQGPDE